MTRSQLHEVSLVGEVAPSDQHEAAALELGQRGGIELGRQAMHGEFAAEDPSGLVADHAALELDGVGARLPARSGVADQRALLELVFEELERPRGQLTLGDRPRPARAGPGQELEGDLAQVGRARTLLGDPLADQRPESIADDHGRARRELANGPQ